MQIAVLGPLEVRADDGGPADVPGARLRGLLVALALRAGQVVPKSSLVDWIWGEEPPADAANALQRLVSRLRKALPGVPIEGHTDGYRLALAAEAVDAVRFERLTAGGRVEEPAERARGLREALGLWRGAALEDVGLQDSGAFDAAATRLDNLRLTAAEELCDIELALGRGAALVGELTDLVAANPVRERLVAALMRALAAAGRESEALLLYQRTREALDDALGVDPSPELSALHVSLLRGELTRKPETPAKTNLRAELTSFVGRDADIAAVGGLVAGHRLTTVIGPGGAGKTRLSVEAARALLGDFPDGAWLVELAALGAGGDVAQAALSGLGLRDALLGESSAAEPAERFVAAVRDRETLLILDNCEHVIESAAVFAHRVLGECRGLRILATSREPLGITGEALWPIEPLALPAADAGPAGIAAAPAVRLLRDRANAVRPDLAGAADSADPATLATMAAVVRALDGMPLAIELAAARLRTMSITQLATRLDDRFRLLTGGSRTALPRHKTLRAVVDWSWELLSDEERTVLRRLSVFAGGAGLEAAEQVCAGPGIAPEDVLDLLTALTEKSLLVSDESQSAPRWRMSGTIKEYAAQRLAEADETETARLAHLEYYTRLTEVAEPRLRRSDQMVRLGVLQAEHDNITAAMRGALTAGDPVPAMRLAAAAGWYWWLAGHRAEGRDLITAATDLPGDVPHEIQTTVYAMMVMFVTAGRGDEQTAARWILDAYRLSQGGGRLHPLMGFVTPLQRMLTAPEEVRPAFERLLGDPDPWARALARWHLGKMSGVAGDEGRQAKENLEQALAEFRALGERFGISLALTELADRLAVEGAADVACVYYEEAVKVLTEVGAVEDVIRARAMQALRYWQAGDRDSAAASIAEAGRLAEHVTWPEALAELALAQTELAWWGGDPAEARRQLDLAVALLGAEADQVLLRSSIEDLRGRLAADLDEARAHHSAACAAAAEAGFPPVLARALSGVADFALRDGDAAQAARLLGAGDTVRGLPDATQPDNRRIAQSARDRLGEAGFTEAVAEGAGADWAELVRVTLAS